MNRQKIILLIGIAVTVLCLSYYDHTHTEKILIPDETLLIPPEDHDTPWYNAHIMGSQTIDPETTDLMVETTHVHANLTHILIAHDQVQHIIDMTHHFQHQGFIQCHNGHTPPIIPRCVYSQKIPDLTLSWDNQGHLATIHDDLPEGTPLP